MQIICERSGKDIKSLTLICRLAGSADASVCWESGPNGAHESRPRSVFDDCMCGDDAAAAFEQPEL